MGVETAHVEQQAMARPGIVAASDLGVALPPRSTPSRNGAASVMSRDAVQGHLPDGRARWSWWSQFGLAACASMRSTRPTSRAGAYATLDATGDGTWASFCLVGPDGRRAGFPVPGRATADGMVAEAEPGVFELTCTGGAQAKCVRFGYRPWETGPDGRPMRVLYNACVRMVRADYGGDGHATTRDGMPIDIYDAWKIQTADLREGHDLEAASPEGRWGATSGQGQRVAGGAERAPSTAERPHAVCTVTSPAPTARRFNRLPTPTAENATSQSGQKIRPPPPNGGFLGEMRSKVNW
jgi:hypothetical protein